MTSQTITHRLRAAAPFLALFLVTIALRAWFSAIPPYGDEGAFYYTARDFDAPQGVVHDLYAPIEEGLQANVLYRPVPIFWYRPMHFLLLSPAAEFGFEAYRAFSVLLTSMLPVLATLVLRGHGVRPLFCFGGGVTLTLLPFTVLWSVITLPDALMTTLFLAGYLLQHRHHHLLGAGFLLAAAWTKETAIVGIGILFVESLVIRWRSGERPFWPLRLDARGTALLAALALAPLPLIRALLEGGWPPGGPGPRAAAILFEDLFGIAWFAPLAVAGLFQRSSRRMAALSIGHAAFYLGYNVLLGRGTPTWYPFAAMVFSLLAATAALDALIAPSRRPNTRRIAFAAAGVAALLVLVAVAAPASAAKSVAVAPLSRRSQPNLSELRAQEMARDAELFQALGMLALGPDARVFAIDLYGSYVLHPLVSSRAHVTIGETQTVQFFDQHIEPWAHMIESDGVQTFFRKRPESPLNVAVLIVYRDCFVYENAAHAIIKGEDCKGRLDRLLYDYDDQRQKA